MIFNESVIGNHPASSGYIVECFVKGGEVIDTDPSVGFPSGSGRLKIEFPEFAITGLEFQGKNLLLAPTGEEFEDKLMDGIEILEANINLKAFFSGDLNGATLLASQNIKKIDVYTGIDENFAPDSLGFSNRVSEFPVNLSSGEQSFNVNVISADIDNRVEENIFYKVIPNDFLTFADASSAVSGVMFSGFQTFPKIDSNNVSGGKFVITRSNANDIRVGRGQTVEIFESCTIVIDDTIPLDFYAPFRMRTNGAVTFSGSGIDIKSSSTDFTVSNNKITIPTQQEFSEFDVACLLDGNDVRTGFIVGEL